MTILLLIVGVVVALTAGLLLGVYCTRVDRALVARAQIQAEQRRAEAAIRQQMQSTVQQLFEAARRL